MKRATTILTLALLCLALTVGAATGAKGTPKAGDYAGETKSTVRNVDQAISFKYKKSKNGKGKLSGLGAYFPIDCSGDGFDLAFGGTDLPPLKASVKKNGKIPAVVQTINLQDPALNLFNVPPADMKAELVGKITGKKAKGTWTVSSTSGHPCSGKGTWEAERR